MPTARQANTAKLSIRLLKGIETPNDALKDDQDKLHPIELTNNPEDKKLWAGQVYGGDPGWFSFFDPEEIRKLQEKRIFAAGGGAILFVRVADAFIRPEIEMAVEGDEVAEPKYRWMAVCFGMGYNALRQDKIEPNFGTIVALNKIGQNLIRSIDTKRPEDSTIQTRTQNSRKGDIFDFGIDTNRIILHSITGGCDDENFATTLTGNEGLSINCEANYATIALKCQSIYNAYLLTDYETRAPWYGKILPVKDQEKITALNIKLVEMLNDRSGSHNVHLAPPEIVEFQDIEKFRYVGTHLHSNRGKGARDGFDDLDIQDFLSRLQTGSTVTMEVLESTDVQVSSGDNGNFRKKWPLLRCFVCEITSVDGDVFHVLSNGEWYEVNSTFVAEVKAAIADIPAANFRLPNFDDGVHREIKKGKSCLSEGAYNREMAQALPQYILCDRENIPFTGENGPIEFCDLFSTDKKIIHVKMRGASSNLSHHFMQGYVSAEAFRNSAEFRKKIRERKPATEAHVPESQPACRDYEVVFAFIQHNQRHLPFFSQIALKAVYQIIRNMDYGVSILWIDRNKVRAEVDEDELESPDLMNADGEEAVG